MKNDRYKFYSLDWDTAWFNIPCAKIVLEEPLTDEDWTSLVPGFADYKLIVIENKDADPANAQWIGKNTNAFLADINIEMQKHLRESSYVLPPQMEVRHSVKYDERILAASRHTFTRLISDPELARRGGGKVLEQILINAFDKSDKYFALSYDDDHLCDGYFLFFFEKDYLQARQASALHSNAGTGTRLFTALEYAAWSSGITRIHSGLSLYNKPSMNIHIKFGYRLTACHQIYHLWNDVYMGHDL